MHIGLSSLGRIPLTCMIPTFNELSRIESVLDHAEQWADEVLVIDKSSTDGTAELCAKRGPKVRVVNVPFSPPGHDDFVSFVGHATNEWVYVNVCSETPTRKLIETIREFLDRNQSEYDLIEVPRRMYSLGSHTPTSPWSIAFYRFLFHKTRAEVCNTIHANVSAKSLERVARIPYSEDCCVYHLTHVSARKFFEVHLPYVEEEARKIPEEDVEKRILQCFNKIGEQLPGIFRGNEKWPEILSAWCIYNLGVCLFLCERLKGGDAVETYKSIVADLLEKDWGIAKKSDLRQGEPIQHVKFGEKYSGNHGQLEKDAARAMSRVMRVSVIVYYICYPREIFRYWRFHLGAIRRKFFRWTMR